MSIVISDRHNGEHSASQRLRDELKSISLDDKIGREKESTISDYLVDEKSVDPEAELIKHESEFQQLTLDFDEEEKRQLESDMRSWRSRLEQFDRDLQREPQRVREFYEVRAKRVEPVGLVYLWPETN